MIYGAVQGIGFRPFLYRLAQQLQVNGWVSNIPQGVIAEIEGDRETLDRYITLMHREKPDLASIHSSEVTVLDAVGYCDFQIRESSTNGTRQAVILPDIATCPDCLRELHDPSDRRYGYPFINCTNCGPRWSIMDALPYDRKNTSMKMFTMCPECQKEYEDPLNRRFHAQPNACPVCGPQVTLRSNAGTFIAEKEIAIQSIVDAIKNGKIVAVKGIGGYHLMADPYSDDAVQTLRSRKHREEKPFAVMMPDIAEAEQWCRLSEKEIHALKGTAAPIVLVRKQERGEGTRLSELIAPNNPFLGIMLPYAPLHHLLMRALKQPVIATSGNIADEPICIDDQEALERLGGIADLFLMHDRPIVRHADDSIVRVIADREAVFRRGRGLAPLPLQMDITPKSSLLAVGGHLKNTVALNIGASAFVSQHIGDLETERSMDAFRKTVEDIRTMYALQPETVVADRHPDYLSSKYAQCLPLPLKLVQHHAAHIYSCMAENRLKSNLMGVAWDGTGYGDDGTIWGGEFFIWKNGAMKRIGTFRSFPLPGGWIAVKEPRRAAFGLFHEYTGGNIRSLAGLPPFAAFSEAEMVTMSRMIAGRINAPRTSSAGRLFDAVSSLLGIRQRTAYEGQAAMDLEAMIDSQTDAGLYRFTMKKKQDDPGIQEIDWQQMIAGIIDDVRDRLPSSVIAQKFHNTLSEIILAMAEAAGERTVVLSGGCFQNAYLTERTIDRLREFGFNPYWHQRIPPNDGGISLGQLYCEALSQNGTGGNSSSAESVRTFNVPQLNVAAESTLFAENITM
jgi:hydrogenase maturation protein HypF